MLCVVATRPRVKVRGATQNYIQHTEMAFWKKTATMLLLTLGLSSSFSANRGLLPTRNTAVTVTMMAGTPVISEWKLLKNGSIVGTVKNHPIIDDGDIITTSRIANPTTLKNNAMVVTESGSKYKLGSPATVLNGKKVTPEKRELGLIQALRKASTKFSLTGQEVGGTYMLSGKGRRSTSGKSVIWTAYKKDDKGFPKGDALTVKLSSNVESIEREADNYRKVTSGRKTGLFVKYYDYVVPAGTSAPFNTQCALVMERGEEDLKAFIARNGPLEGKQLREAAITAIRCLQAVHAANLVWTDLKTENFVVQTSKGTVFRGIDLESAMPIRENPVDYSPEACPPEFADAFLSGTGPYFVLEYNYDIWSLGMMLFEMSTGESVFEGVSPAQITKTLKSPGYVVNVSAVPDEKLRDLVASCLQTDPVRRPKLTQVFIHPYFLTTGIGPFSF